MSQLAVSYGRNAVQANSGGIKPGVSVAATGAVASPGSGVSLETETVDDTRDGFCQGNDGTCRARAAKGTEWCVGHLRSRGEL